MKILNLIISLAVVWCAIPARADEAKDALNQDLSVAAMIGEVADVKSLLAKGADANTKSGNRPVITWAAQNGQIEIVKILLDAKADINATDGIGQTAVMRAVAMGHKDMVDELIKSKANLNVRDTQGRTALSVAKDESTPEMVALLSKHGAE